jgi:cell volume regulation protein A
LVADHRDAFEAKRLCEVIEVNRSSFYAWEAAAEARAERAAKDAELAERIRVVHAEDKAYGAPRVTAELNDGAPPGERVNHKRVARVMRVHAIAGIRLRRRVRTTVPEPADAKAPDLLKRDFTATAPNRKYVGDITYLPPGRRDEPLPGHGDRLLFAQARRVGGRRAHAHRARQGRPQGRPPCPRQPPRSDLPCRPAQYTSKDHAILCKQLGITLSLGGVGTSADNALAESFNAALKRETLQGAAAFADDASCRRTVFRWAVRYNTRRRHSYLGQVSPNTYENHLAATLLEAPNQTHPVSKKQRQGPCSCLPVDPRIELLMSDTSRFAALVLVVAVVGLLAVLSNRLTQRVRVPAPLLVLVAAAVAVKVIPDLSSPSERLVERSVTLALICILFDGGLHMGWSKFRAAAAPITVLGVLGTFLTVGAVATLIHLVFGLSWFLATLVATAVSPTDPAVVFSVLGQREVSGRSGTILEGESGANDPVGIALMASLLTAGSLSTGAFGHIAIEFALQMVVGGTVGLLGGRTTLWFMRSIPLPAEGLYPLRSAACALILFAVATLAHGSGFLAVFVAGILLGEARAPYKREMERFHSALASLGEIVAFTMLGLTVDLAQLAKADVWAPGILIGAVLAFIIRPVAIGLCLIPARLQPNERNFVLFAGLKGAVPILLGSFILAAHVPDAERLYGIVVVVVVFSVLVQGSLVSTIAGLLRVPMRSIPQEPWAVGVRLGDEPDGVHRLTITSGAPADGQRIDELRTLPEDAWISLVVRDNRLLRVHGDSRLRAGDDILVLADANSLEDLIATFTGGA